MYIGREGGSSQTHKSDYVIYGGPLTHFSGLFLWVKTIVDHPT